MEKSYLVTLPITAEIINEKKGGMGLNGFIFKKINEN